MFQWNLKKINLKFKTDWHINGGSANQKTNDFIVLTKDGFEGWSEISSSTKNNDLETITKNLNSIDFTKLQSIDQIYSLSVCPQVMAGLEMAWIHLQCKLQSKTIFEVLNIPIVTKASTSFSIPILNEKDSIEYLHKFKVNRFPSCKVKIMGHGSLPSLSAIAKNYSGPIRLDANESFKTAEEVLIFIDSIKNMNIELLEQPLHRDNIVEAKILKSKSTLPIIGDESLTNNDVTLDYLDCFHGLNIKLMKSGGYNQAIKQLKQCREIGLKTMVGCMVETSLNISSALNISANCDWLDLDGHLLLDNDPFTFLNENRGVLSKA